MLYLDAKVKNLVLTAGEAPKLKCTLRNIGNNPATFVKGRIWLAVRADSPDVTWESVEPGRLLKRGPGYLRSRTGKIWKDIESKDGPIDQATIDSIRMGEKGTLRPKRLLWVIGYIHYQDTMANDWEMGFAMFLDERGVFVRLPPDTHPECHYDRQIEQKRA